MIVASKMDYLEHLIDKYSDMVYRLAMSRTRNIHTSQDVYQEVFLRLSRKIPEFENEEHEKAWIIKVTINCSKNMLVDDFIKNTTILKEDITFETEERNEIYFEVIKLPKKYRTIIHLFYYEGYKVEEISKILDMNINTVKSHLFRARDMLKNKVEGGLLDE